MAFFKRLFLLWLLLAPLLFAQRVVTLAPALTEIVFALGQGDLLVGDTKFCDYPPAAVNLAKVSGYLDLNLETLVSLQPSLVIGYPEHADQLRSFQKQMMVLIVPHRSLADIFASIRAIGKVLAVTARSDILIENMRAGLDRIARQTKTINKSVLLVAGRNPDDLRNITIIGRGDFLDQILKIAGGRNAYSGSIPYPNVSLESVLSLNPDFILEISTHHEGIDPTQVLAVWHRYPLIRAVKYNRVRFIEESYWLRPGPRLLQVAEELYRLLHYD